MKKKTSDEGRIFLSYRREDSSGYAGRLFDRITQHFGKDRVFMDISDIEPGVDFVDTIEKALSSCDAFLVLIGKEWLTCRDEQGHRRLDNPDDFIRLETSTALKRDVRVIPVLVEGATMPTAAELPDDMATLARRNAQELSDLRWGFDCEQLLKVLEKVVGEPEFPQAGAVPAENGGGRPKLSGKAIAALVISVLVILGYGAEEVVDSETAVGAIFLSVIALVLAIVAFFDIRLKKNRGKSLAITGIVLSLFVCLGVLGNLTNTPADLPAPVQDSPVVAPASSAGQSVNVPQLPLTRSTGNRLSQEPVTRSSGRTVQPSAPKTIDGNWRGNDGLRYAFQQQGEYVQVVAMNNFQVQMMSGEGSFVSEGQLELQYILADYTTGRASLSLSADGRQLMGTYHNLSTGYSGALMLSR